MTNNLASRINSAAKDFPKGVGFPTATHFHWIKEAREVLGTTLFRSGCKWYALTIPQADTLSKTLAGKGY